jgi:hypothetical protein
MPVNVAEKQLIQLTHLLAPRDSQEPYIAAVIVDTLKLLQVGNAKQAALVLEK